jgi:glycosyltransferase 2 family protein
MKNAVQAILVTVVLSALGVFTLLGSGKEFNLAAFSSIVEIHPLWAMVFLVVVVSWWLCAGWRIQLLSSSPNVSLWRATRAFLLYLFGASVTPNASGANVAMAWYLAQYTNAKRGTAVAVFTLALDLTLYAYALPLAFIYLQWQGIDLKLPVVGSLLGIFIGLGMVGAFGLAYGVAFQAHRLEQLVSYIFQIKFLQRFQAGVVQFVRETATAMQQMRSMPLGTQLKLHLATALSFILHLVAANLVLAALGLTVHHGGLIAAQVILVFFGFFIPTPGGAGYYEVVLGTTGAALGVAPEAIIPFVMIWRILSYYLYVLIGPFIGGQVILAKAQQATE